MNKYGESLQFYLVDVKDIESEVVRSTFDESALGELANSIIATGCLLKPLILKQLGPMKYKVLDGHFEYYAAVSANQKDTQRILSGMVSAFVVKPEVESVAVEQAHLLNKESIDVFPESNRSGSFSLETRLGNLETRLDDSLREVRLRQNQDIQRLGEQIAQLQLQIPKRLEPLDALNTLEPDRLAIALTSVGLPTKKSQETAEKIIKERKRTPFSSLQNVVARKVGISEKTMIKIVDTWTKLAFFF